MDDRLPFLKVLIRLQISLVLSEGEMPVTKAVQDCALASFVAFLDALLATLKASSASGLRGSSGFILRSFRRAFFRDRIAVSTDWFHQ